MIPITDTADLGRFIRDERKRQHMTQTELADVSGVGITYLSQLENGKETAEIGKALNVLTMLGMDLYAERRA